MMTDQISINWHVDDVFAVDDSLTRSQAKQVLYLVKHNHDSSIGVNWDVIRENIRVIKGE